MSLEFVLIIKSILINDFSTFNQRYIPLKPKTAFTFKFKAIFISIVIINQVNSMHNMIIIRPDFNLKHVTITMKLVLIVF